VVYRFCYWVGVGFIKEIVFLLRSGYKVLYYIVLYTYRMVHDEKNINHVLDVLKKINEPCNKHRVWINSKLSPITVYSILKYLVHVGKIKQKIVGCKVLYEIK
jgi:predicted transcriptional regulator